MDCFSTLHDPADGLADHFILLNSILNELSVESKNAQIGVRTGKLWSSEVGVADSQGWYGNSGIPPFSILATFCSVPGGRAWPQWSQELIYSVLDRPTTKNRLHNEIIFPEVGRNC